MAKKTAKTEEIVSTDAPKEKAPKVEKPKMKLFIVPGRELTAEDKLATQARVIVETLHSVGKCSREELLAALEPKLVTRQPVERILGYYQKTLETKGFMSVEKVAEAA